MDCHISGGVVVDTERKAEQQHLDVLYARLDELRPELNYQI